MCDETVLNADQVRDVLRKAVAAAGGQRAWANANGLGQPYVALVLGGNRAPGPKIVKPLGLEGFELWRRIT